MEKSSKSTPTFAKGDRVVLVSLKDEIYEDSLLGRLGWALEDSLILTTVVQFDGVRGSKRPYNENLRHAKSYYIKKFKEAYEN